MEKWFSEAEFLFVQLDTARVAPPEPPQKSFIAVVIPDDARKCVEKSIGNS